MKSFRVGEKMKIGIGNDHVAYTLKLCITEHLRNCGHEVVDFGHHNEERTDYPIYGEVVANAVLNKKVDCGILICGTGVGISIAANKVNGIRAVVCSEPYSAMLSKQHNNTNILAFGSRVVGVELAKMIVDSWLCAQYEEDRHGRRVEMIKGIEEKQKSEK